MKVATKTKLVKIAAIDIVVLPLVLAGCAKFAVEVFKPKPPKLERKLEWCAVQSV